MINPRNWLLIVAAGLATGLLGLVVEPAYAHGFGDRYDLPVPLFLYIGGAGAAVAFSFVVIGAFVRGAPGLGGYPRVDLLRWWPFRLLSHPATLFVIKLASVAVFLLLVVGGLIGEQASSRNLAPTMVWVIWWVGVAYLSAFVGNVWALINPWKIIFGWLEGVYSTIDPEGRLSLGLPYPRWLGAWPAVTLFAGFAWIEVVFPDSSSPRHLSTMALFYSVVSWGGMLVYGKHVWLRHGDAFALIFGIFSRFSPTEVTVQDAEICRECSIECRDRQGNCVDCYDCYEEARPGQRRWNLRPFGAGLLADSPVRGAEMVLVLVLLATVTFDGFTATPAWVRVLDGTRDGFSFLGSEAFTGINTLGLLAFPLIFLIVFYAFSDLMVTAAGGTLNVGIVARGFVYSLTPIALAYHMAHFFSFLLVQGQLIIPLVSDPMGFGWDLFGTADRGINIAVINARTVWFVSVAAIVVGHIVAVFVAHIYAMRLFADRKLALRSQYPMLALMVGYTVLSLWIIAQPITERT